MSFTTISLARRDLWLKAHIYLALTVGFLFALLGLTGSMSLFGPRGAGCFGFSRDLRRCCFMSPGSRNG